MVGLIVACAACSGIVVGGPYESTVHAYCQAYIGLCGGTDYGLGTQESACEGAFKEFSMPAGDVSDCIEQASDAGATSCQRLLTCSQVTGAVDHLGGTCVQAACEPSGLPCCTNGQICRPSDGGTGPGSCGP